MNLAKEVYGGDRIPWGYGVTYWDWARDNVAICHPVPLNLLIRGLREVWWRMATGLFVSLDEKIATEIKRQHADTQQRLMDHYKKRVWDEGYKEGYKKARDDIGAEIKSITREVKELRELV